MHEAIAMRAEPPENTILMPTRTPIAQAAVPGSPAKMTAARIRSTMPLASMKPQRPDNSRLCSSAYMIEATPSIVKNTMSTKVSDSTPLSGQASSTMPAPIPSTAERRAHQKPGAWRIQKVVIRPMTPLMRKSQPSRISTARVAIGGSTMAMRPSTTRRMPSTRNIFQCSCSEAATRRWNCSRFG